jgi:hypothetical protein
MKRDEVREWWIGRTADDFDKWLTRKHPTETKCRHVFISTDGSDPCVEYIPVIEKSAYDSLKEENGQMKKRLDIFTCNRCQGNETCPYAWDHYNTSGDCLAEK